MVAAPSRPVVTASTASTSTGARRSPAALRRISASDRAPASATRTLATFIERERTTMTHMTSAKWSALARITALTPNPSPVAKTNGAAAARAMETRRTTTDCSVSVQSERAPTIVATDVTMAASSHISLRKLQSLHIVRLSRLATPLHDAHRHTGPRTSRPMVFHSSGSGRPPASRMATSTSVAPTTMHSSSACRLLSP